MLLLLLRVVYLCFKLKFDFLFENDFNVKCIECMEINRNSEKLSYLRKYNFHLMVWLRGSEALFVPRTCPSILYLESE